MGSFSLVHWIVVLGIIVVLFGAGRLSTVMGDFAKGIKAFKAGLKDEEATDAAPVQGSAANPSLGSTAQTNPAERPQGRA